MTTEAQRARNTTLFLGFFAIIGLVLAAYATWAWRHAAAAERWPTTVGTLEKAELRHRRSEGNSRRVAVRYRCVVDGASYVGTRLAFGYQGNERNAFARDLLARLRRREQVVVRYAPHDPRISTLAAGPHKGVAVAYCAAVILLAGTAGWERLRRHGRWDAWSSMAAAAVAAGLVTAVVLSFREPRVLLESLSAG